MKNTRVVFFGTPDLAVTTLERLIAETTVVACVTQPDKPKGRTQELSPSPVKQTALQYGIKVLQPKTLKREKPSGALFYEQCVAMQPDVAVVVAYGKIIPEEYLSVPRFGFVNIHPSLLPQLRGPSPINFAIWNGVPKTGVTIMQLDAGMDSGPILGSTEIHLASDETAETLTDRVKLVGADLLMDVLPKFLDGRIQPQPQDHAQATYSRLITTADGQIDWSCTAEQVDRQIRALTPWPGCYAFCNEKRVKILQAHPADGQLIIDRVQPEGKKPMAYADFLRGHPSCAHFFRCVES